MRRVPMLTLALLMLLAAPAAAQETTSKPPSEPAYYGEIAVEVVELRNAAGARIERATPGEPTTMRVTFTNNTEKTATGIVVELFSEPDRVRMTEASATLGDLAPGASATGVFSFVITDAGCAPEVGFGGVARSSLGETPVKFSAQAQCPGPRLSWGNVEYVGGDGDGVPEPGERLQVFLTLRNDGADPATGVRAVLKLKEGDVTVVDATSAWPDIAPGREARATQPFVIQIAATAKRASCETGPRDLPVVEDDVVYADGESPDTPVSSDGSVSILPAPADDTPAQSEPGSAGGEPGSTGEPEPAPDVAAPPPTTVEPDPSGREPAPDPTPPAEQPPGEPEPAPHDMPVAFAGAATVTASGTTAEIPIDSGVACIAMDSSNKGAPEAARQTGDPTGASSSAAPLAGVVVAAALAVVLRRRALFF